MESNRLPRFKRAPPSGPIQITDRDHEIIRLVHRHRFLYSSDIAAFAGGSDQQVVRRLQLLYHHGYLERPRCQLDYYHQGGSRKIVYGLGDKGAQELMNEGVSVGVTRWNEKNSAIGRPQLEHSLLVSQIMIGIEVACRHTGAQFIPSDKITFSGEQPTFRWRANIGGGVELGVLPDHVFALDLTTEDGLAKRAYFFLEADRGTMPVIRHELSQSSMYRKLLAYAATWSQGIHRTRFGWNRFRVLAVAKSAARVDSLIQACSKLRHGHGLFLFADRRILERPEEILSAIWRTGRGESASLLD